MLVLQLQAWLMIAVTIFCAVRAYHDFANGNIIWGVISLLVTVAALIAIVIPIPTHAVKIDLSR